MPDSHLLLSILSWSFNNFLCVKRTISSFCIFVSVFLLFRNEPLTPPLGSSISPTRLGIKCTWGYIPDLSCFFTNILSYVKSITITTFYPIISPFVRDSKTSCQVFPVFYLGTQKERVLQLQDTCLGIL